MSVFKSQTFYHERKFLNKKEGMAAVEAYVVKEGLHRKFPPPPPTNPKEAILDVNAYMTVSDCNRQITLDFSVWKAKSIPAQLAKIDSLIDTLNHIADALVMIKEKHDNGEYDIPEKAVKEKK